MSDLIVIGYENPQTARQAYEQVQRLQQDVVDLSGLGLLFFVPGTVLIGGASDEKELAEELSGSPSGNR